MPVTLWDHIDRSLNGGLRSLLIEWHTVEGVGTPTMAKRLNDMGFDIEQRTVWRWITTEGIDKASVSES